MTDVTFILWLQQFANGFLDWFFTTITKIGNPEYYIIVIPLFYWCGRKKDAFRFALFFLISSYVNFAIKSLTDMPRPSADQVRILYQESTLGSSSFPSGHTQGAAAFWGYVAWYFRKKSVMTFCIIIIFLVGLSRLYLGLHYPIDILVGLVLGVLILLCYNGLLNRTAGQIADFPLVIRLLVSIIIPIFLLMIPGHDIGMLVGFAIGLLTGYQLEAEYLNFNESGSAVKQVIKFLIGMGGFFGIRILLKDLFILIAFNGWNVITADVVRYGIIGFWAAYLAPWLFIKLGLSRKKSKFFGNAVKYF